MLWRYAEKKLKRSRVDRTVDKALYIIFSIQACLCIFGAVAYSLWLVSAAVRAPARAQHARKRAKMKE